MMTIKQMVEVLKAFEQGKKIQCKSHSSGAAWIDCTHLENGRFDFIDFDYRVARDPRVIFIREGHDGKLGACYYTDAGSAGSWAPHEMKRVVKFVEVIEGGEQQ